MISENVCTLFSILQIYHFTLKMIRYDSFLFDKYPIIMIRYELILYDIGSVNGSALGNVALLSRVIVRHFA
jgi:hypothetical protein